MGLIDKLKGELFGKLEEYGVQQLKDLRRFVILAIVADPTLLTEDGLKRMMNKGIKWVMEHGTPTDAKVRKALKIT